MAVKSVLPQTDPEVLLKSLAKNPAGANLFVEAFSSAEAQDRAYQEALDNGTLVFNRAVEIASVRLRRALDGLGSESPGEEFLVGVLEAEKYKTNDGIWDERACVRLVDDAQTSYRALLALKYVATAMPSDERLPALENWRRKSLLKKIKPPKKLPGPSPYDKGHRDILIVAEIRRLEKSGFRPTRNIASSDQTSACDVIVGALGRIGHGVSYKAVEKIWSRRSELAKLTI